MAGNVSFNTEYEKLITGTIAANGQSVDLSGPNGATIGLQITGTWSGTLVIEASQDGTNYVTLSSLKVPGFTFLSSLITNGLYLINATSYVNIRVRASAWTSGTANITAFGHDSVALNFARSFLLGADGTQIGNNGDKLKVDANLSSGQLVPTITNKLRFRYAISDVNLPNTGVYQTIYSRSGSGLFFGTQLGFDNAKVAIRVTIDGGAVFDISLADVKKFEFNDTTDGRMQMGGFLTAVGNFFDFSSRFAIPYSSSILIEAASTDGANHKLKQYMSIHTEDT